MKLVWTKYGIKKWKWPVLWKYKCKRYANVGDADFTGTGQKAIEAFGEDNYQSIKYYYDKDQFKNRRWY